MVRPKTGEGDSLRGIGSLKMFSEGAVRRKDGTISDRAPADLYL